MTDGAAPFAFHSAVHLVRPTNVEARDLDELLGALAHVPDEALFYHTVQSQLRHSGGVHEATDDMSAWVGGVAQERETAERLAYAAAARNGSAAEYREAARAVLAAIPEASRRAHDAPPGGAFRFLVSETLVLDTGVAVSDPLEVLEQLMRAGVGTRFYHLVEEPWRDGGESSLARWLEERGEIRLARALEQRIAEQLPFDERCRRLFAAWRPRLLARRVSHAADARTPLARSAERDAAARLVGRLVRRGGER